MNINVLTPGLLTTIQDLGRYGYQKYGIIVSGAMDTYAARLSNILVGNEENEGVLEITLIGPSLSLPKGSLISITGAKISPSINNVKVPMGRPIYLKESSILKFGACVNGSRCYLAAAGGFDVPVIMGSKSTYLRAKFGGKDGRSLKKNDVLKLGRMGTLSLNIIDNLKRENKNKNFASPSWHARNSINEEKDTTIIRVFEDMQYNAIKEKSLDKFFDSPFTIDVKSDRMGYRLKGQKIELKEKLEMISGEVSFGTIQIPPDGNPIILLADRGTSGGYPKIAHVVSCDLPKLVQLKPLSKVKFKKVTLKEAEEMYLKREAYICELKKSIKLITISGGR